MFIGFGDKLVTGYLGKGSLGGREGAEQAQWGEKGSEVVRK